MIVKTIAKFDHKPIHIFSSPVDSEGRPADDTNDHANDTVFKIKEASVKRVAYFFNGILIAALFVLSSAYPASSVYAVGENGSENTSFASDQASWTPTPLPPAAPTQTTPNLEAQTIPPMQTATPTPNDSAGSASPSGNILAPGATWYVATSGSDTYSCTIYSAPCASINGALGKAASGDTIKVATGTYIYSGAPTPNVVIISKSITISGGWDSGFTSQSGYSTIDGSNANNGILVNYPGAVVTMDRFVIQNSISGDSGGIYLYGSTFTLANSSITNNQAVNRGAGIFVTSNATLTLTNNTISGNTAGTAGGGIYVDSGSINILYSTIAQNTASDGGGMANNASGASSSMKDTVLADNTAPRGSDCSGPIAASNHNVIGTTSGCTVSAGIGDQFNVDPLIDALSGMPPMHALKAGSPAINTADGTVCPTTDEGGTSRPQGTNCDVGAYEYVFHALGSPTSVSMISGSPQSTAISTSFASSLVALVQDQYGDPLSGITVTFTAPSSGASGTFSDTGTNSTNAVTDVSGRATASSFTANGVAGSYIVNASVSGIASPASFQLQNYVLTATTITVNSGSPQSVAVNTGFTAPLKVLVEDQFNNPLSGVSVTFTAPSSGASGTFNDTGTNSTSATTGSDGIAAASTFTANDIAGSYTVNASVSGIASPASFQLQNEIPVATTIAISSGSSQSTLVNTAFVTPLKVLVKDQFNNPLSGVSVTFTAPSSGASGTFGDTGNNSTSAATGPDGIAAASVFTANDVAGGYVVNATVTGIPSPASFQLYNRMGTWYVSSTGSDSNSCSLPSAPCLTINGAIGKATDEDTIKVTVGTYTGSGTEVVLIDKSITLSGGWDSTFATQASNTTIDGGLARRGITITSGTTVAMDHFTIQNGYNGTQGGGIYNAGALTLGNSMITNNKSLWQGGGIYSAGTAITIDNTIISGNSIGQQGYSGGGGGGGISNSTGAAILNNSTVSDNFMLGNFQGTGIYNSGSTFEVNNSTVSGNGSDGISNLTGNFTLSNSTVSNNGTYGIYNYFGTVILQNSIVAGNKITPDCVGTISSAGYNLIGDSSNCAFTPTTGDLVGTDASPIDPRLAPLQNNGGTTPTQALMSGSPAIDAGNPATPGSGGNACLATDQRGVTRPVGAACDIGAFEGQVPEVFLNISGNVGTSGATLSYTDGTAKTVTADGNGNYSLAVLAGWSGTVTPSKAGYLFTPAARTYSHVMADQTSQNYTLVFTISGNTSLPNVQLSYMDGTLKTVRSDGSGNYSIRVPQGWSGTITPSLQGYSFVPPSRTYSNVTANQSSQNYILALFQVKDPSFEASYGYTGYWSQYSQNFGTPLCTITQCGNGGGTAGPRTGLVWGWFGGTSDPELAGLAQNIFIPSGYPDLKLEFYLWIGYAEPAANTADVFRASIDNTPLFYANGTQLISYPTYTSVIVDASAFSDNNYHSINFYTSTNHLVNFNLDDVALVSSTFFDVPYDYWALQSIERLYSSGITGGCSTNPLDYCPDSDVTRDQMAVFLERGIHGSSFNPPTVPLTFTDTSGDFAQYWIEALKTDGITGGCGTNLYCPTANVTRAQMAIFLLKSEHGAGYTPPPATGTKFTDVPATYWAASWIEQLANEGITSGCGTNLYCPDSPVTRAQMAEFLVKTFNLP